MSLSTQVLIGLVAGIGAGLFLGDPAAPLSVVGRAFVLAVQVTVLPFMSEALITGLGQLDGKTAMAIARAGGFILLILWLIADGTTARLFAYWYEGRSPDGQRRRWSIVHDVLGWVG